MEDFLVPSFDPSDEKGDFDALNSVSQILTFPFSLELEVFKGLFIHLIIICRNLVLFPIRAVFPAKRSHEYYHMLSVLISLVISATFVKVSNFGLGECLDLIKKQKVYKIWAIYTIFIIVGRFFLRIHKFTHQIIRGAIRKNKNLIIPIILHSVSNFLNFQSYNIIISTHIAGVGGKHNLFFSACLHIQAIYTKKFVAKITDPSVYLTEIQNRLIIWFSFAYHALTQDFGEILMLVLFEYGFAFSRFLLASISPDCNKLLEYMQAESRESNRQIRGGQSTFQNSLFINITHESFTIILIQIFIESTRKSKVGIIGTVLAIIMISKTLVHKQEPEKVKPENKDKTSEKDVKPKSD